MGRIMKKTCTGCKKKLPATAEYFYRRSMSKDGLCCQCKLCSKKYWRTEKSKAIRRKYQQSDRAKASKRKHDQSECGKARIRECRLKRVYSLTSVQHKRIYIDQDGCCAICERAMQYSEVHTDHSHKTGKVRGLLCGNCNHMLGLAHESIKTLSSAIDYLEETNG